MTGLNPLIVWDSVKTGPFVKTMALLNQPTISSQNNQFGLGEIVFEL